MPKSMENRTIGVNFEEEMCEYLSKKGWWVLHIPQTEAGQPADILGVKSNLAVLIDCKVCTNDKFPLSRIEGNQELAMKLWMSKRNDYCYFALKMSNGEVYMLSYIRLYMFQQSGKTVLSKEDIVKLPKRKNIFPVIEREM